VQLSRGLCCLRLSGLLQRQSCRRTGAATLTSYSRPRNSSGWPNGLETVLPAARLTAAARLLLASRLPLARDFAVALLSRPGGASSSAWMVKAWRGTSALQRLTQPAVTPLQEANCVSKQVVEPGRDRNGLQIIARGTRLWYLTNERADGSCY
jgi:hypothetical protein